MNELLSNNLGSSPAGPAEQAPDMLPYAGPTSQGGDGASLEVAPFGFSENSTPFPNQDATALSTNPKNDHNTPIDAVPFPEM